MSGTPFLQAALRDADVTELDPRGLMPLDEARAIVADATTFTRDVADRVWAALLSLGDAAEACREAGRLTWDFHVRGMGNLALVERYGDGILPWLASRVDGGTLRNVPWCVLPCLLALPTEGALRVALTASRVDARLAHEQDGAEADEHDVAADWIDHHPGVGLPLLARWAEAGEPRAEAVLRDRAAALGGVVREILVDALGELDAARIVQRFELPSGELPPDVQAALDRAPVATGPGGAEPKGPPWSIALLDRAAASYELPLWDNANFTCGAVRVSAYASRHGDVLAIQQIVHWPGAQIGVGREVAVFGPGATRGLSELVVPEADVAPVELDAEGLISVDGVTNALRLWGDRDVAGARVADRGGVHLIPQPMPPEHNLVSVRGVDVAVDYHLPDRYELDADARATLRLVTPDETLLAALCLEHRDQVMLTGAELAARLTLPEGAVHLFDIDEPSWPSAGEPASSSADLVCIVEALRQRRALREVPRAVEALGVIDWYLRCAELRFFDGGDAWPASDGPIRRPLPEARAAVSPYQERLLELGWPHLAQILHAPGYNVPGGARQTVEYLIAQPGPALRLHWPRNAAALWARAIARAERRFALDDAGVAAAFGDDRLMFAAEAAALVAGFVARGVVAPVWAAADLPLVLEGLVGVDATIEAFAAGLAAAGDAAFAADRPAVARAVFELGFVLRRAPEADVLLTGGSGRRPERTRAQLVARLAEVVPAGAANDVARAVALVTEGRAGAERCARTELDLTHLVAPGDRAWARARLAAGDLAPAEPDAQVAWLGGDAVLERYAARAADVADPAWAATQLAALRSPQAAVALRALRAAHPAAREAIDALLAARPA
jgi:hypothetical protein